MTGLTGEAGGGGPNRGGRDEARTDTGVTGAAAAAGGGWLRAGAAGDADQLPTSGRDVTWGGDWPGARKPHSHLQRDSRSAVSS